jgi:hypothetical protein
MKKNYIQPRIEIITARVERGFSGSYPSGMLESVQEGATIDFGDPNPYYPYGQPMLEGLSIGPNLNF